MIKNQKNLYLYAIFVLIIIAGSIVLATILNKKNETTNPQTQSSNTDTIVRTHIDATSVTSSLKNTSLDILDQSNPLYIGDKLKNTSIPTNRIWSSVPFKGELLGLYTFPLASKTKDGSLLITSPEQFITEKVVTGPMGGEVFYLNGESAINKVYAEDYSDLTVKLSFKDDKNTTIFTGNFTQGSPYIFIQPNQKSFTIKKGVYNITKNNDTYVLSYKNKNFGIFTNAQITATSDQISLNFSDLSNAYLTFGLYTDNNAFNSLKDNAQNTIKSINATFAPKDQSIETAYNIDYENNAKNKNTIIGLLPHQYQDTKPNSLYSIKTLRGEQKFISANTNFITSVAKQKLLEDLPYTDTDPVRKNQLITYLNTDIKKLELQKDTSYFGGKNLSRIARLIQIADNLEQTDTRNKLVADLRQELENWFTYTNGEASKHFKYDKQIGGLIGYKFEFGSEQYNDHHFHYGYFIYAAAVVSKYDKDFLDKNKEFIQLLVADIANTDKANGNFPYIRNFDFYEGHSWASGTQPFDDGNNQESTSEAVNAWYALWLWGKVSNDAKIQNLGEYLYAAEINSTNYYWLNRSNNTTIFPEGYKYKIASLVWGGKFEFNTFFSTNAYAIQGIQILPITPGSVYLYDKKAIERDQKEFPLNLAILPTEWTDITLMYYGTANGLTGITTDYLNKLKIDDGNSITNLYYWLIYWEGQKGK